MQDVQQKNNRIQERTARIAEKLNRWKYLQAIKLNTSDQLQQLVGHLRSFSQNVDREENTYQIERMKVQNKLIEEGQENHYKVAKYLKAYYAK